MNIFFVFAIRQHVDELQRESLIYLTRKMKTEGKLVFLGDVEYSILLIGGFLLPIYCLRSPFYLSQLAVTRIRGHIADYLSPSSPLLFVPSFLLGYIYIYIHKYIYRTSALPSIVDPRRTASVVD